MLLRQLCPTTDFGQSKIHNFDLAGFGHHDVGGFYVAVGDAFFVGSLQALSDLGGVIGDLFQR